MWEIRGEVFPGPSGGGQALHWTDTFSKPQLKSYKVSRLYAGQGETEEAFRWLEKAAEVTPSDLLWVNTDPQFDFLRSDPRFIACLRRVGFTEEIIEASKRLTREFTLGGI